MAGGTFWYDVPDYWDTCVLGIYTLPGISRVEIDRGVKMDVLTAPGQDGATVRIMGSDPASVDITCTMWRPDQWELMQVILEVMEKRYPPAPKKGAPPVAQNQSLPGVLPVKPLAWAISHPVSDARGIAGVVIQKIIGPRDGAVVGTKEVQFKCVENKIPVSQPVASPKLNLASRNNVVPVTPPSVATPPKP